MAEGIFCIAQDRASAFIRARGLLNEHYADSHIIRYSFFRKDYALVKRLLEGMDMISLQAEDRQTLERFEDLGKIIDSTPPIGSY